MSLPTASTPLSLDPTADRPRWQALAQLRRRAGEWSTHGATVIYVLGDRTVLGALTLADEIRPTAREAVDGLHRSGTHVVMITGDARPVAESVAAGPGPSVR
ncbi:HAD family hydrolase [Frankia sp. Mgl5]|nr:HAD family hydrolase [Frankia sp. Mgl5]